MVRLLRALLTFALYFGLWLFFGYAFQAPIGIEGPFDSTWLLVGAIAGAVVGSMFAVKEFDRNAADS